MFWFAQGHYLIFPTIIAYQISINLIISKGCILCC